MTHLTEIQLELIKRGVYTQNSLTDKQNEAFCDLMNKQHKEVFFGGAAGGGKSWLGCEWLFDVCVIYPGTKWFIGREELKRIRASTLITWYKVCKSKGFDEFRVNFQDNFILFDNGSRIDLLDLQYQPRDPLFERFGSLEYTGGWIEEAGETMFDAYEILKTRTGRHMNKELGILPKILCTLNPKKNWCYKTAYLPNKQKSLPSHISFIQSLVTDNPHLDEEYINNLRSLKDKAKRERLLNGNWEYDDDPSWLIDSYDLLLDIFKNEGERGHKYITCDAARYGSDKAIIGVWDGFVLIDFFVYEVSSTTEISDKITEMQKKYVVGSSKTIVDADGVGGGVVDQVRCVGFENNGRPIKLRDNENFDNIQSQCGFTLADIINESRLAIRCDISTKYQEEIIEELEQLKRDDIENDNKNKLMKKKKIKDNIGRSPDWRDMLLMRMFFELKPATNITGMRNENMLI